MNRGEIWWVNSDPAIGGEIRKRRPAVIVSNNTANKHLNRVQVVPLTSQVGQVYPCEVLVYSDGKQGKAKADQITTVSKLRMISFGGRLTAAEMQRVEQAIKIQLGLT